MTPTSVAVSFGYTKITWWLLEGGVVREHPRPIEAEPYVEVMGIEIF